MSICDTFLQDSVRRLYQTSNAVLTSVSQEKLQAPAINNLTQELQRYFGKAHEGDRSFSWQLVRKRIARREGDAAQQEPSLRHYWRREALFYQAGLPLAAGLAAPRVGGVYAQEDAYILDIEYLQGRLGSTWPAERYALAAMHLGRWQGRFLVGEPLPAFDWLGQRYLQQVFANRYEPNAIDVESLQGFSKLHRIAERVFAWLDQQQTLCHGDLWGPNLFDLHGTTYAIDWSSICIGPVGLDVIHLLYDAFWLGHLPFSARQELEAACLEGYLTGLREAGWRGDALDIWRRMKACAVMVFGLFAKNPLWLERELSFRQLEEQRHQKPLKYLQETRLALLRHLATWLQELW